MKKIYLASPYSDDDSKIEEQRFEAVCKVAGNLIKEGNLVFFSIAHSHPIAIHNNLPKESGYWQKFNESWIDWCDELVIANLSWWPQSKGIKRECKYAEKMGKKISITLPYTNEGILNKSLSLKIKKEWEKC